MIYCSVRGCFSNDKYGTKKSFQFFRIPHNSSRTQEWAHFCCEASLIIKPSVKRYVCELHFTDSDFYDPGRLHLKETAVPSLKNTNKKNEQNSLSEPELIVDQEIGATESELSGYSSYDEVSDITENTGNCFPKDPKPQSQSTDPVKPKTDRVPSLSKSYYYVPNITNTNNTIVHYFNTNEILQGQESAGDAHELGQHQETGSNIPMAGCNKFRLQKTSNQNMNMIDYLDDKTVVDAEDKTTGISIPLLSTKLCSKLGKCKIQPPSTITVSSPHINQLQRKHSKIRKTKQEKPTKKYNRNTQRKSLFGLSIDEADPKYSIAQTVKTNRLLNTCIAKPEEHIDLNAGEWYKLYTPSEVVTSMKIPEPLVHRMINQLRNKLPSMSNQRDTLEVSFFLSMMSTYPNAPKHIKELLVQRLCLLYNAVLLSWDSAFALTTPRCNNDCPTITDFEEVKKTSSNIFTTTSSASKPCQVPNMMLTDSNRSTTPIVENTKKCNSSPRKLLQKPCFAFELIVDKNDSKNISENVSENLSDENKMDSFHQFITGALFTVHQKVDGCCVWTNPAFLFSSLKRMI